MAKFVPLIPSEENSSAAWYTSVGAGFASGLLKTVEGIVSLGAELVDLGADSNTAADVENFFDKINEKVTAVDNFNNDELYKFFSNRYRQHLDSIRDANSQTSN